MLVFPVSRLNVPFVTISLNDYIHTRFAFTRHNCPRTMYAFLEGSPWQDSKEAFSIKKLLILLVSACIRMTDDWIRLTTERSGKPISIRGKGNAPTEIAEKFERFQLCRTDRRGRSRSFSLKHEGDGSFSLKKYQRVKSTGLSIGLARNISTRTGQIIAIFVDRTKE